jgi:CRP-like cAMP-binding protein
MLLKIALIDGNESQSDFLKELLYLANYEIATANDYSTGLAFAKSFLPNIILANLHLPKIEDGLNLFHKCNNHPKLKTIPFIFIAKKATKTLIRSLMDKGVDDVITTPFKKYEVLRILKSRLKRVEALTSSNKKSYLYLKPDNLITIRKLEEVLSQKKLYTFKANETIYCEGNKSNHIFLIKSGMVKTFKTDDLGKEFITSFFTSEQYFGYASFIKNKPHFENAKAITTTYLYKISREEIVVAIQKNDKILLNFMDVLANDLIKLKKQLILQAYASVRKKTAETLLNFKNYFPLLQGETITLNRTDLADSIGIAKETLTRTLHDFKNEKLISLTPKSITILNKNKLKKVT